jgi:hypothetical protein
LQHEQTVADTGRAAVDIALSESRNGLAQILEQHFVEKHNQPYRIGG